MNAGKDKDKLSRMKDAPWIRLQIQKRGRGRERERASKRGIVVVCVTSL